MSISPVSEWPTTMPGRYTRSGALTSLAHDLLGLELRSVVGVRELLALVEHVLAEQALESPATAIELVWWKRPTSIELANSTTWRVPSTLAFIIVSSSAAMS